MHIRTSTLCILLGISLATSSAVCREPDAYADALSYVQSLEWTPIPDPHLLSDRTRLYREWLAVDEDHRYVALIAIGALQIAALKQDVKAVADTTDRIAVARAFALARLGEPENLGELARRATATQVAGDARSLLNLDAIELLAYFGSETFCASAWSARVLTDETYQLEAIRVAEERHHYLFGRRCKKE